MKLFAAGFFAGAGFRGYRILKEKAELDSGWRGGWAAVNVINFACALITVLILDATLMRPAGE
jgi:formate/nitrite transporter FocA (FNT family)